MIVAENLYLLHEGVSKRDGAPVGSGRYPLGSGGEPYQHARDFKDRVAAIRKANKGITDKDLIAYLYPDRPDYTIRKFREDVTRASAIVSQHDYYEAKKLSDKGWSNTAIAEKLGRSSTGVAKLLARDGAAKANRIENTAEAIKKSLAENGGYIDVGAGVNAWMGVSDTTLKAAVKKLEEEGYEKITVPVRQAFGHGTTTLTVIAPEGTSRKEAYNNMDQMRMPVDVRLDSDGNRVPLRPIQNVSSKRIEVRYAEDGGGDKDGVVELRRGVSDLDLGNARYAQVRIGVDGTHYIKGMAIYADDLPDGIDIRVNSNKKKGTPLLSEDKDASQVLKPMKDPASKTNPFQVAIKAGGQNGALNIMSEEGDWEKWSKTLPAQFLAKQYLPTAKKQLKLTTDVAKAKLEELKSLTNPTVKRYLLNQFANGCDADAVDLKAMRLPGQAQKVLLPLPEGKEDQCYCPTLKNGTQVALVRYPHAGTFEIPILTVNNRNKYAQKVFGNAEDAIGIHPSKASILSGADFDGDTVTVLPITSTKIRHSDPLPGLKDFDPKTQFSGKGMPEKDRMKKGNVQNQMGAISNLITDMSLKGATPAELSRAVAHSMVVIDANKHGLNYKASEKYFGIQELRNKYQDGGGVSTLISRASSQYRLPDFRIKAYSKLTPEERKRYDAGEVITEETGKMVYSKRAKGMVPAMYVGTRMANEVTDARGLMSGTSNKFGATMESYYADYANEMKALANEARAESRKTIKTKASPTAKKAYANEVKSLDHKLTEALKNAPLERKAQALTNFSANAEFADHPEYSKEDKKKAKVRYLAAARTATGAGKQQIKLSAREWEAIQAGAISDSKLVTILENSDNKVLRQWALPKGTSVNSAKLARAKSLLAMGYSWADVADVVDVPVSTLEHAVNGGDE